MLTLRGIITLIVLIVLFALAVVWISKQGGWKGEGCGGNCASCHSHCEKQDPNKKACVQKCPRTLPAGSVRGHSAFSFPSLGKTPRALPRTRQWCSAGPDGLSGK